MSRHVVIVGDPQPTHVGHHLQMAAGELGIQSQIADTRSAYGGSRLKQRLLWWTAKRPARLASFSAQVLELVTRERPDCLIATGIAPIDASTLQAIGNLGVRRINFLTDDPWNPAHRASWFLSALPHYDHVWSPRHANLHDLRRVGVRRVGYLSFAHNPQVHYPQAVVDDTLRHTLQADVLIAGNADRDRVALVSPLIREGLRVALYGDYWGRYRTTASSARGRLDAEGLRQATGQARVCLGLVRRANRDGHSMRTFEVPAMGGCLLAEKTSDHEKLFGRSGEAVLYFEGAEDVVSQVRWLIDHGPERDRLAAAAHARIVEGAHAYRDRLAVMLETP
jgi:spore maturation protein CgeB